MIGHIGTPPAPLIVFSFSLSFSPGKHSFYSTAWHDARIDVSMIWVFIKTWTLTLHSKFNEE